MRLCAWVCQVVPKGSTWARNPIPRIHTDNVGMAWVGKCDSLPQYVSPEKTDCQNFPSPCPDIDRGWYMSDGLK